MGGEQVVAGMSGAQKTLDGSGWRIAVNGFGRLPQTRVQRNDGSSDCVNAKEDRGEAKSTHCTILFELAGSLHADLQTPGFAGKGIAIYVEEVSRRPKLPIRPLQSLPQHSAVYLVEQHPIEIGHAPAIELVEKISQPHVKQLLER